MTILQPRLRYGADNRFFLTMAVVMAVIIIAGFSMQLGMGRSTFRVPWLIHAHAVLFFGWTAFYVLQAALVDRGSIRLHRRLGWLGAGWAIAILGVGIFTTVLMVRRGAAPFFFEPAYFLFMNSLTVFGFVALVAAAIVLRRRTDWHRRLLFCAMALLTGPAFGRLLPMPLMIPWAEWGVFAAIMALPIIGVVADWRRAGRVHPAWWCGIATIIGLQCAMDVLAQSDLGLRTYRVVTAGAPGERVAPLAFPAPPPF